MRSVKALILIGIFVVISSVFVISQQDSTIELNCDPEQVILRLSDATNAHGALYNNLDYPIEICYNDIFGVDYFDPRKAIGIEHVCDGSNSVINLSRKIDGHADITSEGSYSINICYGDLRCRASLGEPNEDERLIVSLSSNVNAHLASDDSYDVKIYCSSELLIPSVCGNDIPERGEMCDDGNLIDGDGCDSVCQLEGLCGLGETRCSDGTCSVSCNDFDCNNNGICEVSEDFAESCQCADCYGFRDSCQIDLICDFRTEQCNICPNSGAFANNINSPELSTCLSDPRPNIEIVEPLKNVNPRNWPKFSVNEAIDFDQEIKNANSVLRDSDVTWAFGDGEKIDFQNCILGNECDTTHSYTQQAHYFITASATETSGLKRSSFDRVDILVYKTGLNLFAIISKPRPGILIDASEVVRFDGSDSFVAECFPDETTCLDTDDNAGKYGLPCYQVGNLWCYDYPVPNDNFPDYKFTFEWTFSNDGGLTPITQRLGTWNEGANEFVIFDQAFEGSPGINHTVQLITKYKFP